MDDFEEQIEAKYLLLKFCMNYSIMKNIIHSTQGLILMLGKVMKLTCKQPEKFFACGELVDNNHGIILDLYLNFSDLLCPTNTLYINI